MISASGTLIISKQGRVLFLKRGPGGDAPGFWCFPGGRLDGAETTIDAAIRETEEETGKKLVSDNLFKWTRTVSPQMTATDAPPTPPSDNVDFTTYITKDSDEFVPDLEASKEHVAYAWAPITEPPQPLHPGCETALARFMMNELDLANAMVAGQLSGPQKFGGFTLFNIRITGTGVAFRARKMDGKKVIREEEYPVRDPSIYLTPEFLERCNGLPVVLEHPTGQRVDGDEFNKRTIGTVFKPYIKGDEVWAIAKIYDEDAIELMSENQLSTSPGVVWHGVKEGVNITMDGKNFLFEGNPSLMDHIAVCRQGVWDKGGPPAGVETVLERKDSINMEKEELTKLLDEHRKGTDTAISSVLAAFEGLGGAVKNIVSRMDAEDEKEAKDRKDKARKDAEDFKFGAKKDSEDDKAFKDRRDAEETMLCDMYKACGDSEEESKEKAAKDRKDAEESEEKEAKDRKDAEEKEEKEEKEAKDRKDSTDSVADLRKRLEDAERIIKERVPAVQPKDEDAAAFSKVQSRLDDVYSALGRKTPVPMQGETLLSYRRRGLQGVKDVSRDYAKIELGVAINDATTFAVIENGMLKEVEAIARTDAMVPAGQMIEVVKNLPGGSREVTWRGHASDWMSDFAPGKSFAKIHRHNANGLRSASSAE